ncbi:MAG: hypothetical protein ABIP78_06165 [Pyrinomonadaceae bacterium]
MTDIELKDFSVYFEAIAGQVPAGAEINGEIITGDQAIVTANLPNDDGDKNEIQTIKLRKENGVWVIQTADDVAAKRSNRTAKITFTIYGSRRTKKKLKRCSNASQKPSSLIRCKMEALSPTCRY